MGGQINPKIVGATVIGFALVAGAYTVSNFGESNFPEQTATVSAPASSPRVAIDIADTDQNGIEDWRDVFVDNDTFVTEPLIIDEYVPPETLTGKTGVSFMEGVINSKIYSPVAPDSDEVISDIVSSLDTVADITFLEIEDLDIMEDWDDEDIVNYANTVAATIYRHSDPELENEIELLNQVLKHNNETSLVKLNEKALAYKGLFDDTTKIPVPKIFTKEHLDLVNTYKAVAEDIEKMTHIYDDPLLSFVYTKRYPEDVKGMGLALQNMFLILSPHADLFTAEDPALLFIIFSPDYQP